MNKKEVHVKNWGQEKVHKGNNLDILFTTYSSFSAPLCLRLRVKTRRTLMQNPTPFNAEARRLRGPEI